MMTVLEKTELNIQYFTGINFWAEIRTQIEDFVSAFLKKKNIQHLDAGCVAVASLCHT